MSKKHFYFWSLVTLLSTALPCAASVTFDLTGGEGFIGTGSQPFSVTSGGSSVSVSGYTHSGGGNGDAPFSSLTSAGLHQNGNGMGVRSSLFDVNQLDAVGSDDLMRLEFGGPVKLVSMVLSLAFGNDEFDMAIDNVDVDVSGLLGTDRINAFPANGPPNPPSLDYTIDFSGIALAAFSQLDLYTDDNGDGYKIVSITVAPVPEATSVIVWSTLGTLGVIRSRRKRRN